MFLLLFLFNEFQQLKPFIIQLKSI